MRIDHKGCQTTWAAALMLAMVFISPSAAQEVHEIHGEGHHYRHRVELFLGNSHHDGENGFTVGLTYAYRLHKMLGIGGLVEGVAGDFEEWVFAAPVFIYPYRGLRFVGAPGLSHEHGENEFLFRTGVGYEFEIDRWSITPEFNVDFVDGNQTFVFGVSFGLGF